MVLSGESQDSLFLDRPIKIVEAGHVEAAAGFSAHGRSGGRSGRTSLSYWQSGISAYFSRLKLALRSFFGHRLML